MVNFSDATKKASETTSPATNEAIDTDIGAFLGNLDNGFGEFVIDTGSGDLNYSAYAVRTLISDKGYSLEEATDVVKEQSFNSDGASSFDTPGLQALGVGETFNDYDVTNKTSDEYDSRQSLGVESLYSDPNINVNNSTFNPDPYSRSTDPVARSGLQDLQANTDKFTSNLGDIGSDTGSDVRPSVPGTGGRQVVPTPANSKRAAARAEAARAAALAPKVDPEIAKQQYQLDAAAFRQSLADSRAGSEIIRGDTGFDQTVKPFSDTTDTSSASGDRIDFFSGEQIQRGGAVTGDLTFDGEIGENRGAFGDNASQADAYEEYIQSGSANKSKRPTKRSYSTVSSVTGIEATFEYIYKVIDKIKRDLVLNIYPTMIYETPIDTGTARKGWQVSNSTAGIVHVPYAIYEEMHGHKPYIANVPEDIFNRSHDTIVIGNSVNWIMDLEHGDSAQNSYFIESNVIRIADKLK